ncbi:MAG: SGNH/GDSL hydrolase family protein [Anaerolineae bacterium]|nr:SGNH/GDSL hydrolase family protein [Anaerolineae bacterium]
MPERRYITAAALAVKEALTAALAFLYAWSVNTALQPPPGPAQAVLLLVLASFVVWLPDRLPAPAARIQAALALLLVAATALVLPGWLPGYGAAVIGMGILHGLLGLLNWALRPRDRAALGRLALSLASLAFTALLVEWLVAPAAYRMLTAPRADAAARASAPLETGVDASSPFDLAALWSGVMHTEIVGTAGPGPAWGPLVGWGTNTDTTLHTWMDGVFDVEVKYNRLGFRGPEISYEKPGDGYRIMIVGDSFVEALQVKYEDTVYAQLGAMLAGAHTPGGQRFEVFGVGATGWGTLQAFLYYHYEGVKFDPDLIVHVFFINDVVDNYPEHFYGEMRKLGFVIEGDGVRAYRTDEEAPPEHIQEHITYNAANPAKRLLDALPGALQSSSIVGLVRLWADPPRLVAGLEGDLRGVHPQNYIYVAEPEIEGYAEAWYRTQRAYEIWAKDARAHDAQLMVLAIDISPEMVDILAGFNPEATAGWSWDADLPYERLGAILAPLDVPLILTRAAYQAYADSVGQPFYPAIFILEDGHWTAAGHRITAELLAETLRARGVAD